MANLYAEINSQTERNHFANQRSTESAVLTERI